MNEILCSGHWYAVICPMRGTCHRYTALMLPEPKAARMTAPLYQLSEGGEWKCDEYWRVDAAQQK